jgi:hypothetical protein
MEMKMKIDLLAKCVMICALVAFPVHADETECDHRKPAVYGLSEIPQHAKPQELEVSSSEAQGRKAIRALPTEFDNTKAPSLLIIPGCFRNGVISVDILARQDKRFAESRAFAGIAYRIQDDGKFEAVYLRALNGQKANPPSPRDKRAIQYFAHPDWTFEKLRATYPEGQYESGANIGPDEWINLSVAIDESKVSVFVNNEKVLAVDKTVVAPSTGSVGLFIGYGTEAYFSNLRMEPSAATTP